MDRVVLAVDAGVGVTPEQFVAAWAGDVEASASGAARVEPASGRVFLPGLVEFVVLPLAVGVASSALYGALRRVLGSARRSREVQELEFAEFTSAEGDRLVVVRSRRELS